MSLVNTALGYQRVSGPPALVLSYLADLPIDEVKLDCDFMARAMTDERTATVVGAAIDLAHRLGLVTVAEGVESAEIAARMRDFECDVLQGYYFSPPLTADELIETLSCERSGLS